MSLTPFTKQQLLPQEEKLEIARHKSELFIGIPKETSYQERRICLTPDAVNSLTSHGHRVLLESGAGLSSSYTVSSNAPHNTFHAVDAGLDMIQSSLGVDSDVVLNSNQLGYRTRGVEKMMYSMPVLEEEEDKLLQKLVLVLLP